MNQQAKEEAESSSIAALKKIYGEISFGMIPYYINDQGKPLFLILEHQHGNGWSLPKGKVEKTETETQTAFREVFEEAGLTKDDFESISEEYYFQTYEYFKKRDQRLVKKFVGYYLARLKLTSIDKVKIRPREIKSYAYFTFEEAVAKSKSFKMLLTNAMKAIDTEK
jgi:8-oxo-dGTP pyrophosphatase MutT (NUDIX family)